MEIILVPDLMLTGEIAMNILFQLNHSLIMRYINSHSSTNLS